MPDLSPPPVALSIAGSDSGGGAGVQADLHAFAAHGVHGCTALTALTAQSTTGVDAVLPVPPAFVVQQVRTVLADLPVGSVKTGMLGSAEVVDAVALLAEEGLLPRLVVDPVMVASSGARLLDPGAERSYRERLLPRALVVTPNRAEAAALVGGAVRSRAAAEEAARAIGSLGPQVVVVTGGDGEAEDDGGDAVDVVWDGLRVTALRAPRVRTRATHGTGCTFAASTAALLARGVPVPLALQGAKAHVHALLVAGADVVLGGGPPPVGAGALRER